MSDFLRRSIQDAAILLLKNASVAVPVAVFIVLEKLVSKGNQASQKLSLDIRLGDFIEPMLSPAFILGFVLLLTLKAASILFTNTDMYFAFSGEKNRLKSVLKKIKALDYALYYGLSLAWYVAFAIFAYSGSIFLYDLLGIRLVYANLTMLFIFALLFPIFYAGLSVFPFVLVLHRLGIKRRKIDFPVSLQLYRFYALRSVIDLFFVGVVPLAIFRLEISYWIKLLLVLCFSILITTFIRTVSIRYKSFLFDRSNAPLR